ncbi:MAG: hypothetical protein EXR76_03895 [Myxococcales bacterium]|nr:hypothetical protein [Myxococcales bacterium]
MAREDRWVTRGAGVLAVGLAGVSLGRIEDERGGRNRRWRLWLTDEIAGPNGWGPICGAACASSTPS